ncbi:Bxi1 protein [Saccharomycopsis crataegensis]|uniref:Bxi1 protein n=1 Tax=Saccharomycopsis crataegensis TaxID=43959 RepID=A0AAV5QLB3_9ASCO|nr:Bxi1 protein [Saccharomycopsis crataegensis]
MSQPAYEPLSPAGAPPSYSDEILNPEGAGNNATANGDNIPDDFKYGTNVAGCELSIRQMFVRKVYTLLTAQLFVTFAIGLLINVCEPVKQFAYNNSWLLIVSLVGSMGFMIAAFIKSRSYPYNLLLLAGFTICESYAVGVITTIYDTNVVINAVLLTSVIFLGLTVFALQTKYDFTSLQGYLFYALLAMVTFSFFGMFLNYSSTTEYIYSIIGALIFSVYIIVDTQIIMRKLHPEEEVSAAITLYLDIINLFLHILRIMSHGDD